MFIADFHIHSKYSRATSKNCVAEELDLWARRKGLHVIGTGDFTHPAWRQELQEKLVPAGEGLYALKDELRKEAGVAGTCFTSRFIVSGEISSIYKKNGKVRKIHNLILLPSLEAAGLISRKLETIGNLHSDGRPILGLDSRDLLEIVLDNCPEAIFIPAHIWTPHFSLYGAYSGFDEITECFEDLTGHIYALETGLSSDPPMNWRLSALDRFAMVSNSDAHSPANLAREANLFATELSYPHILRALKHPETQEFYGTLEFFPEEGKYHYDGHRACKVCCKPAETKAAGGVCPVCGGRLTVGVLHRVEALADRAEGFVPAAARHFESIVPLPEIIASSLGFTVHSMKVQKNYTQMLQRLGPELYILREAPLADVEMAAGPCIAEGIHRLRDGQVSLQPGFDGEYGKVTVINKDEICALLGQLCFISPELSSATKNAKETTLLAAVQGRKEVAATQTAQSSDTADLQPGPGPTAGEAARDLPYGLNQEQWEAVSASDRTVAAIAGPGTGKTKTLVCRIAHLVEACGVPPAQITAVTFTNKAAQEMRSRLESHFGDKKTTAAMTIGTFHAICLNLLQQGNGGNRVTLIDEYDVRSIVEEILQSLRVKLSLRDALQGISRRKNGILSAEPQEKATLIDLVYDAYCNRLKQYGVMDYDDILLAVLQRFEPGNTAEQADQSPEPSCGCLLVDEFQDINEIQYRLIQAWGKHSKSIFIIGDPDQSIYGFRGADFRYFDRFAQEFPGIRYIRLTKNYRSTPEILAAAQAAIAQKDARPRFLYPTRASGAKVRLVESHDAFSEAIFVAKEINRLVGGIDMLAAHNRPVPGHSRRMSGQTRGFADIAVLYRTNRQAEVLEQCFLQEGIPYTVLGREEFLADKPVREALAFFKFLLNPGDLISLSECLKADYTGLKEMNLKILDRYAAGEKGLSFLKQLLTEEAIPPATLSSFPKFIDLLEKYEPAVRREKPEKIIASWIDDNQLSAVGSMELLLHTAMTHSAMPAFIRNLILGQEGDVARSGKVYSSDAVSLMTVHAAKGLEFPVTFLCGVNEGLLPLSTGAFQTDVEEERRLFYVALTRAKEEMVLSTSREPSVFLGALSGGLLSLENSWPQKPGQLYKQTGLFD